VLHWAKPCAVIRRHVAHFYECGDGPFRRGLKATTTTSPTAGGVAQEAAGAFSIKPRAEGWLADERELIELGTWTPPTRGTGTPPARRAAARTARAITVGEYAAKDALSAPPIDAHPPTEDRQ
jgi:hypothetical protein